MSYNAAQDTFDGTFRVLDWMTLTYFYGVSSSYNSSNDTYQFDNNVGVFIIDGGGLDIIDASSSEKNIFVDLRPGMHSYEEQVSDYITSANQLTISHGSKIENVSTGKGNDYVIGNNLQNLIITSNGNDIIFPDDGEDVINSGPGSDIIDLSENINFQDQIIFDFAVYDELFDTIISFIQGHEGDIIKLQNTNIDTVNILPLVSILDVPTGGIGSSVVRIIGQDLSTSDALTNNFDSNGSFQPLKLYNGQSSIIITANSQQTGENQNIFMATERNGSIEVDQVAILKGNYLDIDNWHYDNFLV